MRFSICCIDPVGFKYAHFLYDVCKYLCFGIESAGYDCCIVRNQLYSDRINVLVGAHNITDPASVPKIVQAGKYVLFQTEIITGDTINNWNMHKTFAEVYLPLMRQALAVWTGGFNIEPLKQLGIDAEVITFGYHPSMEEVIHKKVKDIDFLYFGSLTDHRKKMVEELIARGGKVVTMFDDAALFRNDLIARTRVNLAPHQGPGRNHMTGKILHLINNRAIVAVERCCDQELYEQCFLSADTDQWVDLCLETLNRPDLGSLAEEYLDRFRKIRMEDFMRTLIENLQSPMTEKSVSKRHMQPEPPEIPGDTAVQGMTSFIIRAGSSHERTRECIENIKKLTTRPYEIIILNSGGTDETTKGLKALVQKDSTCRFIETRELTEACNQGATAAKGEFILLLTDEVVVTEGLLKGLVRHLDMHDSAGIAVPVTADLAGVPPVGDGEESVQGYADSFQERNSGRVVWRRNLTGPCLAFSKRVFNAAGGFDESLEGDRFIEDFCLRVELAGYRNMIAGDVLLRQRGEASPLEGGGRKRLDEKWTGVDTTRPPGSRLLVLRLLEKADEDWNMERSDEALKLILEGISRYPEEKALYCRLAEMLIESRQYREGLQILSQVPSAEGDGRILCLQGYCHEGLDELDPAGECADRVLSVNPDDAPALNLKGLLAYKRGDRKTAAELFSKAAESSPFYGEPVTNLGVLKWAEEKQSEGLALMERGFILSPTLQDNSALYHSAVSALGEFSRAESVFAEAQALHPNSRRITFFYTDLLLKQGKYDAAMGIVEDALVRFGPDEGLISAALSVRERLGASRVPKGGKRVTLSLCMIVKNEERYLARCLNSVKGIVDEMVIVDTGSTDRTRELAQVFGARLFEIPWQDDFAAARNESLKRAEGDWILVLDGDEIIAERDTREIAAIVRRNKKRVAYNIDTRNYMRNVVAGWIANDGSYAEEEGSGWFPSTKVRLFPNDRKVRFVNPVHELVEPTLRQAGYRIEDCPVPVHHYGKLDQEKTAQKGVAYFLLGMEKLKKDGSNAKAIFELAVQATELGRYDDAIGLWNRLIELKPDLEGAYINAVKPYAELGRMDEALAIARKGLALAPGKREAVFHYALCEFYLGKYLEAGRALEAFIEKDPDYPPIIALFALVCIMTERKEEGLRLVSRLNRMGFDYPEYACIEARKVASLGRPADSCAFLSALLEKGVRSPDMVTLYKECSRVLQQV